jgi:hypothetical protein
MPTALNASKDQVDAAAMGFNKGNFTDLSQIGPSASP